MSRRTRGDIKRHKEQWKPLDLTKIKDYKQTKIEEYERRKK